MSDTIKIKGKNYTVCSFRGKVLQNHTHTTSETTITGGGGGGVVIDGTGYIRQNPMRAHTTHTNHTELYLEDGDGNQDVTQISDFHLQALAGHDVIKIWIIREGYGSGPVVGFFNVTLNKYFWLDRAWMGFYRPKIWAILFTMSSFFIAFHIAVFVGWWMQSWLVFFGLLLGLVFIILAITGSSAKAKLRRLNSNKTAIMQIINQRYF